MTPSKLLLLIPGLPTTSQNILRQLVQAGDVELRIPGLPDVRADLTGAALAAARELVQKALGNFEFEFFQTVGVKVMVKGRSIGSAGVRVTETLRPANPVPNLKIVPVLEFGETAD